MNNKGFTLIELLISIMLLTIITSVTTVVVVNIINGSKQKSYDLIVSSVKIGAQQYFEECKNRNILGETLTDEDCDIFEDENKTSAVISFNQLIKYGFLKSSAANEVSQEESKKLIENPITNDDMKDCKLKITKSINDNYVVSYVIENDSTDDSFCPTNDDYNSN